MKITTNRECTVVLSRMPIVRELGMLSCWVRGEEYLGQPEAHDELSLEVVLDRARTIQFVHAITSPEICAMQSAFPSFEADEDSEGSGYFHTEVSGPTAYIMALAVVAVTLGAKRGTYSAA